MEQKTKFIIIGLVAMLVISLFISLLFYSAKQRIARQRDSLKKENDALMVKIEESRQDVQRLEDRVRGLNEELDKVSKEKEEINRKYELIGKEKEELIEQLKSVRARRAELSATGALPATEDAYWAGVLKAKTELELQLGNVRNELKSMQINNEQVQREKSTLELDVNNLTRESQDLKRQFEYNKRLTDSITKELVREKNDKMQVQDDFKLIKNDNALLVRQLKSLSYRKIELEKKLGQVQEEKSGLEHKLADMETILTDNESRIKSLREQLDIVRSGGKPEFPLEKEEFVELPPIIVRPSTEPQAQESPPLVGKILAVNKDNNFVIIDLGEEQGIKEGDTFQVYREDERIADIEVIRTSHTVAACDIKKEITPIKKDDVVR